MQAKELIPATGLVLILIGIAVGIATFLGDRTDRRRHAEGIVTTATMFSKRQELRSSARSTTTVNIFSIMFFEEEKAKNETFTVLDDVEIELPGIGIGDLISTDIENVPDRLYDTTAEGDNIQIIYLASDPERAWIWAEVNDWTPVTGYALGGGLLLVGLLMLLGPQWRARRSTPL